MSMGRAVSVDTLPPPRLLGRGRRRRREAGEIVLPRHRCRVGAVADLQSPVLRRDQQTSLGVPVRPLDALEPARPFSTIAYRLSPGTPERNAANQPCTASATAPSVFGRAFCIVTGRLSSHVSPGLRGSVSTVSVHPRRRSTANDAARVVTRPNFSRHGPTSPSLGGPSLETPRSAMKCAPPVHVPHVPHAASAVSQGSREMAT